MDSLNDYYKQSLLSSSSYSAKVQLERVYPETKPEAQPLQITDNDLILGFGSSDFRKKNVRLLNLNLFRDDEVGNIAMGFLGLTGTGKSTRAYSVAEDFVYRHNNCLFIYDVKGEAYFHKEPLHSLPNLARIDALHSQIGLKRRGLDLLIVSPRSLSENRHVDFYFSISWNWIKRIARYDSGEAVKIMSEILGLFNTDDDSIDILDEALHRSSILDFKGLREFIRGPNGRRKNYPGASKLLRKLRNRMRNGILSDDPRYSLDLLSEMKKRQGRGGVVFQGKIKVAGMGNYIDMAYEASLKACLSLILYDGLAWNVSRDSNAVLKCDTFILFEEFDTLAPDDDRNMTSLYLRNYFTKGRQAGLNMAGVVQEASTVDHELWQQMRILFCAKLTEANSKAVKRKGIDDDIIKELQGLDMAVQVKINGIGMNYSVPECCAITTKNEIIVYDLCPPQSQFAFKRKSV